MYLHTLFIWWYVFIACLCGCRVISRNHSIQFNTIQFSLQGNSHAIHIFWDYCSLKCSIKVTKSRTRIMNSYYTIQLSTGFDSLQVKDVVAVVRFKLDAYQLHSLNLQVRTINNSFVQFSMITEKWGSCKRDTLAILQTCQQYQGWIFVSSTGRVQWVPLPDVLTLNVCSFYIWLCISV